MAISIPMHFTCANGLRDHPKSQSNVTNRKPRCSSVTASTHPILPPPSIYKPSTISEAAIEQIKLDNCRTSGRNGAIPLNKTAESHQSAAQCMQEVSVAACQLIAKSCQTLAAIYDAVMTLMELVVGTCKLVWAVGCLAFATGKWLYATGLRFWEKIGG
jgi:hypothetical protein